jgi:hypothetical protein
MTPEQMECPECGRMMDREEDNLGYFYRCAGMDCLSHYGADEFFPAPPLPMPPRPTLEAEVLRLTEANAALAEELARVRQVLTEVATLDVPRPVKDAWREDGEPSKHDLCKHGAYMYEECAYCVADFARAALSHTGMTGPREGV